MIEMIERYLKRNVKYPTAANAARQVSGPQP
jgi:hypothetical protein